MNKLKKGDQVIVIAGRVEAQPGVAAPAPPLLP